MRIKRRVYLDLLDELAELRERDKWSEKMEGYLNQAIVHLEKSEDPEVQEFVRDCVKELNV